LVAEKQPAFGQLQIQVAKQHALVDEFGKVASGSDEPFVSIGFLVVGDSGLG
jgi:hypothetical protein